MTMKSNRSLFLAAFWLLYSANVAVNGKSAARQTMPTTFVVARRTTTTCSCLKIRGGGGETADSAVNNTADVIAVDGFTLLSDTVIYEKWRRLVSRKVQLPSGKTADFEIVGQSCPGGDDDDAASVHRRTDHAVLIFVWNRTTKTTTLIREYMPSVHRKMYGLAAGMVEADKHDNTPLTAARHELAEECRLQGGEWIRLTGVPVTMDKYSTTALTVYLVLDPEPVEQQNEQPRDDTEEGMEVVPNVTVDELLQRITNSADMTVVGSWASLLALGKLRELGELQ
jgi:ADP-ribose pyrophosphatase YjhB (NUDIX family)